MSIEERDELGDYIACRGQVYENVTQKAGAFRGKKMGTDRALEVFYFLFSEHNKSWQFATGQSSLGAWASPSSFDLNLRCPVEVAPTTIF